MKAQSVYISFIQKLKSTGIFVRPAKLLPGKWHLFEYYTEISGELAHVNEQKLKQDKKIWEIDFLGNGDFMQQTNFASGLLANPDLNRWSISGNYITLLHPDDFRENMELQFAIEKDNLRLLKKEETGKIILFGFFRRVEEARR